jgi:hypothetical protein
MVGFIWNGAEFTRIPFLQVPEAVRLEENLYSCIPRPKPHTLTHTVKDSRWCEPQGERGQFTKRINLIEYQQLAVSMAKLSGGPPISE